jgi:hypothetical protein
VSSRGGKLTSGKKSVAADSTKGVACRIGTPFFLTIGLVRRTTRRYYS